MIWNMHGCTFPRFIPRQSWRRKTSSGHRRRYNSHESLISLRNAADLLIPWHLHRSIPIPIIYQSVPTNKDQCGIGIWRQWFYDHLVADSREITLSIACSRNHPSSEQYGKNVMNNLMTPDSEWSEHRATEEGVTPNNSEQTIRVGAFLGRVEREREAKFVRHSDSISDGNRDVCVMVSIQTGKWTTLHRQWKHLHFCAWLPKVDTACGVMLLIFQQGHSLTNSPWPLLNSNEFH